MPAPLPASAAHADRDRFRSAVTALPPGPLRDVLTAVAYARDAAARSGTGAAPDDRWRAVVAVAERALQDTDSTPRRARRSSAAVRTGRAARHRTAPHPGLQEVGVR
ncbi:MAG: hypothetical protein QOK35_2254 [Pseudonocardiales bacterium]|nr:hypothetical protein [Pseudonocardiales bacterium]